MTTILQMQILMHYYCLTDDFDNLDAPAVDTAIKEFVSLGLIIKNDNPDEKIYSANREALEVYINELKRVPLPTQKWVII